MTISEVQVMPVKPKDGLIAFASCGVGNLLTPYGATGQD